MNDDAELLRRYAVERSEADFTELVSRHLDLVHSTALRLVGGDAHLAQDVTQTVFADLARKARRLSGYRVLSGWLYQATRFAAAKTVRTERRRTIREKEAAAMQEPACDANWEQLRPVLDEALGRLGAKDRDALLLRYFERKEIRTVGHALGTSEEAARKRVDRALEKLRRDLVRRGVTLSAAALATALTGSAIQAAPAALAGTISTAVLTGAGAAAAGSALTFLNVMSIAKLKAGLLGAAVIVGAGTAVVVQRQSISRLRLENQELREQSQQLKQLTTENQRLARLAVDAGELDRLRKEVVELHRLRAEVARLQREQKDAARLQSEDTRSPSATNRPDAVGRFEYAFVGGEGIGLPGQKVFEQGMSLLDLIAKGGGFAAGAVLDRVELRREGEPTTYVDCSDSTLNGPAARIEIRPGDKVHVRLSEKPASDVGDRPGDVAGDTAQ